MRSPEAGGSGLRRARPGRHVDLVDETFVRAAPERVAAAVADLANQRMWWPHLQLTVVRDRGVKGQRWSVTGQFEGSMEIWVEPFADGAIVHHYVRAETGPDAPRDVATRHTHRWKRAIHQLKDRLEGSRL